MPLNPKKYEILTDEENCMMVQTSNTDDKYTAVYRIRALRDFWAGRDSHGSIIFNVSAGELGGFVEREDNLNQYDASWVMDDAAVSEEARVSDAAIVRGNARVRGNAIVRGATGIFESACLEGDAVIQDYASMAGKSRLAGRAYACGVAYINGYAVIEDEARVAGDVTVTGNAHIGGQISIGEGTLIVKGLMQLTRRVNRDELDGAYSYYQVKANRSDGYEFIMAPNNEGTVMVAAGCRYFTLSNAVEHWREARGDTILGNETRLILAHLARMAQLHGIINHFGDHLTEDQASWLGLI